MPTAVIEDAETGDVVGEIDDDGVVTSDDPYFEEAVERVRDDEGGVYTRAAHHTDEYIAELGKYIYPETEGYLRVLVEKLPSPYVVSEVEGAEKLEFPDREDVFEEELG